MIKALYARLTSREKLPCRWLCVTYPARIFASDDARKREHDAISSTIRRLLYVIVLFSLLCILGLSVPDIRLIPGEADIKIPFSDLVIPYAWLLFSGPLILVAMLIYLHIRIGALYQTGSRNGVAGLPFVFNQESSTVKRITGFLFYWLGPCVLVAFAWKAAVHPAGHLLVPVAAVVSLWLLLLKTGRRQWETKVTEMRFFNGLLLIFLVMIIVSWLMKISGFPAVNTLYSRTVDFAASSALSGKNIGAAVLPGANFEDADLRNTDFSHADLRRGNFREATLSSANLRYSNLTGADLRGTMLDTANLDYSQIKNVLIDDDTRLSKKWRNVWTVINGHWDYKKFGELRRQNKTPDLRNVSFRDVDLSYLDLSGADFSGSDFYGVILDKANLDGAIFDNIKNYHHIKSVRGALISNIKNAPDGFRVWAEKNGAVETRQNNSAGTIIQDVLRAGGYGPKIVVIEPGRFLMGEYYSNDETQLYAREVHVSAPFAIGQFEVTVGEFARFANNSGYKTEAEKNHSCKALDGTHFVEDKKGRSWRNPGFSQTDLHPVVCVSWNDVQAYLKWLQLQTGEAYRLPTEKEWEYVAREGGNTGIYWADKRDEACIHANVFDLSSASELKFPWRPYTCNDFHIWTAPVGSYKGNRFMVHDMLGNVWEWVQDCYEEFKPTFIVELLSGQCEKRVFKGGSWHYGPGTIYAGLRAGIRVNKSGDLDGFRVAKSM